MLPMIGRCLFLGAAMLANVLPLPSQPADGSPMPATTPQTALPAVTPVPLGGQTSVMSGGALNSGTSLSLTFAQSMVMNGAEGDQRALALGLRSNSCEEFPIGALRVKNRMWLRVGMSYLDDSLNVDPVRVGDNEIFNEGTLRLPLGWRVDPYIAGSFRTAVTESFRYHGRSRKRIASLWDPVISQESVGGVYGAGGAWGSFGSRLGLVLQQIRARSNTALTDDWKTSGMIERYKAESAIEFINDLFYRFDSTARYMGRLGLNGTLRDPSVWSIRFENEVSLKVWRFIGVQLLLHVIYDPRQSVHTQIRQSLTLGFMQDF